MDLTNLNPLDSKINNFRVKFQCPKAVFGMRAKRIILYKISEV